MARKGATHSLPTGSLAYFHPDLPNRQPKAPRPIHPLGGKRWQRGWEARLSAMGYSYLTLKETWKTPKLCRASEPVIDPSSREL